MASKVKDISEEIPYKAMLVATLTVSIRCPWISHLSDKYGCEIKLLQCIPRAHRSGVSVLAMVRSAPEDPDGVARSVKALPSIDEARFTSLNSDTILGIVTTRNCPCSSVLLPHYNTLQARHVGGGKLSWTLVIEEGERLKELLDNLRSRGLEYRVERVSRLSGSWSLTPRQEEIARAALELGFYETPKRIGLAELARLFGVSPRAVSETLRRAEGKALRVVLDGPRGERLHKRLL